MIQNFFASGLYIPISAIFFHMVRWCQDLERVITVGRKFLAIEMVLVLVLSAVGSAYAAPRQIAPINDGGSGQSVLDVTFMYRIRVDGQVCDPGPILWRGNHIYVQLRGFSSCLGADVIWIPGGGIRYREGGGPGVATVVSFFGGKRATIDLEPTVENQTMRVEEMPNDFTYIHLGDMAPFVKDGRTYIPFRPLTDAMDFKLEFFSGVPNIINVVRGEHAIPEDGYNVRPEHMTVDIDRWEPFQLAKEPYGGWPFSMATLRAMRAEAAQANWAIQQIKKDPETRFEVKVDREHVSIDVRPYNTVNPAHVTFFGTHMVRWFDNVTAAQNYAQDLKLAAATADAIKASGGIVGSGWVAYIIGAPIAAFVVPAAGVGFVWWMWDAGRSSSLVETCISTSGNSDNSKLHKDGEPYLGILYGPHGPTCLPYYSNAVTDSRGYVN